MPLRLRPSEDPAATLAAHHADHLRWLGHKFRGSLDDEELADVLQEAYGRATKALNDPSTAPQFSDPQRRLAWFRTVCSHTAVDVLRARDGRRESERAARPELVPLTAGDDNERPDGALAAQDDDLEALMTRSETAEYVQAILRALDTLPEAHARILRWRYEDNLSPQAIVHLERLSSLKQYEGRHTRAVKALGKALSRLNLNVNCSQARLALREDPGALLDPAGSRVRVHVETCLACRAFRLQLRGALALLPPLPPSVLAAARLVYGSADSKAVATPSEPSGGLRAAVQARPRVAALLAAGSIGAAGAGLAADGDARRTAAPEDRPVAVQTAAAAPRVGILQARRTERGDWVITRRHARYRVP